MMLGTGNETSLEKITKFSRGSFIGLVASRSPTFVLFMSGWKKFDLRYQTFPAGGITCHIHPGAKLLMLAKFQDHGVPSVSGLARTLMSSAVHIRMAVNQRSGGRWAAYRSPSLHIQRKHGPMFHRILFNKLYNPCIPAMQDFMRRA